MDLRLAERMKSESVTVKGRIKSPDMQCGSDFSCRIDSNVNSKSENSQERNEEKRINLNFGIESILQNNIASPKKEKEHLRSKTFDKNELLYKVNLNNLTGWYGHLLTTVPQLNVSSACAENLDINWQLRDTQRERFCLTRRVGHPYQNRSPPKRKKPRTSFTRITIMELEKRFERQKYLASSERSTLARSLKISDSQVKTWFQNRRTKWRRQAAEEKELERQSTNRLLLSMTSFPPKHTVN